MVWILRWFYSSALNVHAFDNSVDLGALIGQLLPICSGVSLTESEEVSDRARSDVIEQFKDNGLVHSSEVDVHRGILPGFRLVDCLLECISGFFLIDHHV